METDDIYKKDISDDITRENQEVGCECIILSINNIVKSKT